MFIQCSLIRDTNFRSLSIIEQTSALLDKPSLDINLKVRFLITAAQLGTRFTVDISLALQYVGKWCIILNVLYNELVYFYLCLLHALPGTHNVRGC